MRRFETYTIATPGHPEPLPLENYICIIALTPDLQSLSFYRAIYFPNYSPDSQNLRKSLIRALRPYNDVGNPLHPCSCCDTYLYARLPSGPVTRVEAPNIFYLS